MPIKDYFPTFFIKITKYNRVHLGFDPSVARLLGHDTIPRPSCPGYTKLQKKKVLTWHNYNLLPSFFNYYLEVINNAFPCQFELRQIVGPLIRPQRTRLIFRESNVLFQLIQLLNYTHTIPTYLKKC